MMKRWNVSIKTVPRRGKSLENPLGTPADEVCRRTSVRHDDENGRYIIKILWHLYQWWREKYSPFQEELSFPDKKFKDFFSLSLLLPSISSVTFSRPF